MRTLHVVGLPWGQVTEKQSWCAYTQKLRRFCDMMTGTGREVILYAGSETTSSVAELVPVNDPAMLAEGPDDPKIRWITTETPWAQMNAVAIDEIRKRAKPGDFLCLSMGLAQQPLAAANPSLVPVEFGIGYEGVFAEHRVYESYAWMHVVSGQGGAFNSNGRWQDAVIPNSFGADEFPFGPGDGGYLLYMGRLVNRKGVQTAVDAAQRAGLKLIIAGQGQEVTPPSSVQYEGLVGPERRLELLHGAVATFVPTKYVEPFGGIAVESMLCGTPVITTDFGAFTETVSQGVSGFRCRTLSEFAWAAKIGVQKLDRTAVRDWAVKHFSTEVVQRSYDDYFTKVAAAQDGGGFESSGIEKPNVY